MVYVPVSDGMLALLRDLAEHVVPAPWRVFENRPDGSNMERADAKADLETWLKDQWSPLDHWGEVVSSTDEPVANNCPRCACDPIDPRNHLIALMRNCLSPLIAEVEANRATDAPPDARVMLEVLAEAAAGDDEVFRRGVANLRRRWPRHPWLRLWSQTTS